MANEWQKILDDFAGSRASSNPSANKSTSTKSTSTRNTSTTSTSKKKKKDDWQSILDDFAGTRKTESSVSERVEARTTVGNEKKWYDGYFQKGALNDGLSIESVSKAILGSGADALDDFTSKFLGFGETVVDTVASVAPNVYNATVALNGGIVTPEQMKMNREIVEASQKEMDEFVAKDLYDENEVARQLLSSVYGAANNAMKTQNGQQLTKEDIVQQKESTKAAREYIDNNMERDSVLDDEVDAIMQSLGHRAATRVLAPYVPWQVAVGVSAYGSEMENALKNGATHAEAQGSALASAGGEILSEQLFGGSGLGEKGVFNLDPITRGISNQFVKTLADYGVDIAAEGFEEIFAEAIGKLGSALYREESLGEILAGEEARNDYIRAFISGGALSGIMNLGKVAGNAIEGTDYRDGLTQNEQKVVDLEYQRRLEKEGNLSAREKSKLHAKVVEDMERGYISTDTIEEALGGEKYEQYKKARDWEKSLKDEYETLSGEYDELYNRKGGDKSSKDNDRELELKAKLPELKKQLDNVTATSSLGSMKEGLFNHVMEMTKGDRLVESYNELARSYEDFTPDYDKFKGAKYEDAAKKTIDSAVAAGAGNSNRLRDFIELAAKTAGDTGKAIIFKSQDDITADFIERQTKEIEKLEAIPADQMTDEQHDKLDALRDLLAKVESGDVVIDGDMSDDGIVLNLDSQKPLNRVVGHEITHNFEKAKNYDSLKESLFNYAKAKGIDVEKEIKLKTLQYEGVTNADPEAELVADLVGDFLFTDTEYVNRLSVENRDVFQWLWDEVKHLYKMATAGSKEARELERVKKAFEDAYRSGAESQGTSYSLEYVGDTPYVKAEKTIFQKEDGTRATEKEVFDSLVGKTISFSDGDVHIEKGLPGKKLYKELFVRHPKVGGVDDVKQLNSDVNYNMEELLTNSTVKHSNVPDRNERHKQQGITHFDTRNVKFYDGNKAYNVQFDIGILEDGRKVAYAKKFFGYDDELTKKIQATEAGSKNSPENQQPVSETIVPEDGKKVNTQYSLGYHAGDLGKAESYAQQGGSRSTGHFGTGTYFVGDEAKISDGTYGKRPHHAVEFDNYNLYKVRNDEKGYKLHDYLHAIDRGFSKEYLDAVVNGKFRASELRSEAFKLAEEYETTEWDDELGFETTSNYYEASIRAMTEVAEANGIEFQTYDEHLEYIGATEKPGDPDYDIYEDEYHDYLKDLLTEADEERNYNYPRFRDAHWELKWEFGEENVNRALQAVLDHDAAMEQADYDTMRVSDSRATVFMKALGYEGIDVRGTRLDNTTYGSVIYDLKGKDLERKKEIGTAKYSLTKSDKTHADAVKNRDWETAQKLVDKAAKKAGYVKAVYHGTDARFTVFDTDEESTAREEHVWAADYPDGTIFLAEEYDTASYYGERVMEMYLDTSDMKVFKEPDMYAHRAMDDKYGYEVYNYPVIAVKGKDMTIYATLDNTRVKSSLAATYDDNGELIPLSKRFDHYDPDIRYSLSEDGAPVRNPSSSDIYGSDFRRKGEVAPIATNAVSNTENVLGNAEEEMFPDNVAPVQDELDALYQEQAELENRMREMGDDADPDEAAQVSNRYMDVLARISELEGSETERVNSLGDENVPAEAEQNTPDVAPMKRVSPFDSRDFFHIYDRKIKSFVSENPEFAEIFKNEANIMLGELQRTEKGKRLYNDATYYATGGEQGWMGQKRTTSESIAELIDAYGMRYEEIQKGLEAIIQGGDATNIAAAKKIEFMLDDRLKNGYTEFISDKPIPPNQDYLNLLDGWNASQVSQEAAETLSDADAPIEETVAPTPVSPDPGDPVKPEVIPVHKARKHVPDVDTKEQILPSQKRDKGKIFKAWEWAKIHIADMGMPFEDLAKATGNRALEEKWDFIHRSSSIAQRLVGKGHGDVKSLKSIRKEVKDSGKYDMFEDYMYHKHNVDRMSLRSRNFGENKAVFGDKVTSEISARKVEAYEVQNPEFTAWAEEIYKYNRYLRNALVEGGVISQETADLWEKMYPHYVPIAREGVDGQNINVPLDSRKTSVNNPVKRAKGGNQPMHDLFDTMGSRTFQTFRAIARNQFGVELKNTLGRSLEHTYATLDDVLEALSSDEAILEAQGKYGELPTFTVFEDGGMTKFEITEEMYEALKPKSAAMQYRAPIVSAWSELFRKLTTEYNPAFMLTNPIKDVQDILLNSQHPLRTYGNLIPSIWQQISNGKYYQEYMENGGEFAVSFNEDTGTFNDSKLDRFNVVSWANNHIEMTPRLAEYMASRKAGKSIEGAMLDAARVTTNFAAGGDVTKLLNANGATFLNASVQGAVQQVRNIREAHHRGWMGYAGLLTRYALAGLPAAILNGIWDDDEDYQELADYVKENYYIVKKTEDGRFIRIPKGRAVAVIQDAVDKTLEVAKGDAELDMATFLDMAASNLKLAAENLAPNNPLDNNVIAPFVQMYNNRTWYDEEIVSSRLQKLPKAEQFDEKTDSLSIKIGQATNTSPKKWNYLLNQMSGAAGDILLPMMTPKAESGDDSMMGNFLAPIRDKFTTDAVLNNQVVTDFRDIQDELTMKANGKDATDEDKLMAEYIDTISYEMNDLYAQKREIQMSDKPNSVKYEQTRELQRQINEAMEDALSQYKNVHVDGAYSEVGDRRFNYDSNKGTWYQIKEKNADGSDNYYYQNEQKALEAFGCSPADYWNNRDAYDDALHYATSYGKNLVTTAKTVFGVDSFARYGKDLSYIKADYDKKGKLIDGSKKKKVAAYINESDADYGERIILFKSQYPADDRYDRKIVEYLNTRDDIDYQDKLTILKELGFEINSKGKIVWD